ncbi:MAG: hypothetical protein M3537_05900 [Chloroflexota bacterium]|nr:hypothetical protein [Chloroflexota bacterium]
MDDLAALILERAPAMLDEAETAGQPRLTELYDEADDWRGTLREKDRATPLEAAEWRAAHAVVMAVSAVFFEPAGDHRDIAYFMEKRNEAKDGSRAAPHRLGVTPL